MLSTTSCCDANCINYCYYYSYLFSLFSTYAHIYILSNCVAIVLLLANKGVHPYCSTSVISFHAAWHESSKHIWLVKCLSKFWNTTHSYSVFVMYSTVLWRFKTVKVSGGLRHYQAGGVEHGSRGRPLVGVWRQSWRHFENYYRKHSHATTALI